MWINYTISFGGIIVVAIIGEVVHAKHLREMKAERDAERAKAAQAAE